jgi:hypothetical protein
MGSLEVLAAVGLCEDPDALAELFHGVWLIAL